MTKVDTDIQSQVLELAAEAIPAFCEDISGMFGVEIACDVQAPCSETIDGLQKRFKKLAAVNSVSAEGVLNGTFYVVFDQRGLFTLAGVVVMLPENRIKEVILQGSKEEALRMSDAMAELGNMMVGTWDRVFREALRKRHRHFKQAGTFIGKPWENGGEALGLGGKGELLFIPVKMTVGSYPEFTCGVLFPSRVLEGEGQEPPTQEAAVSEPVPEAETDDGDAETPDDEAAAAMAAQAEDVPAENSVAADADAAAAHVSGAAEVQEQEQVTNAETAAAGADNSQAPAADGEKHAPAAQDAEAASEETDRPAGEEQANQSPAGAGGRTPETDTAAARPRADMSVMRAEQIMQKEVAWLLPEDTVQDAIDTMQRRETGYVMIGSEGVLEGIVSRSDVAGAVSPYLRPVFAKWKRPLDDATLQIKLSWIMTRPVRTITPQTPLDVIADTMLHFGGRCLPVVDAAGKVQGLVTAFDILKVITTSGDVSQTGRMPQAVLPV
ncbi:MAG: HPP family protein [Anaerohalosphaeraceae bacterium]|jgi:predicted transcriptional regulator